MESEIILCCICHVKENNIVIELLLFWLLLCFCGAELTAPVKVQCTHTFFNLLQYSLLLSLKWFSFSQ